MSWLDKIGFFDSGIGGLSVLRHAIDAVDGLPLLYVADSAHAPYGGRDSVAVIARSRAITRFLIDQGAQTIVVACNTATAVAVERLRNEFSIPIVAMEPALKPAVQLSASGKIAVLATAGTLNSDRYARLCAEYGRHIELHERTCPFWVEAIEDPERDAADLRNLVRAEILPLHRQGVDTYVLGCTHFPFLNDLIREVIGEHVHLVDPGLAVVGQLRRCLRLDTRRSSHASRLIAYSSGSVQALDRHIVRLLGVHPGTRPLPV